MPSSLLLSPEGFRVEPYKLKESCKEAPYILYVFFASLPHARLTAIKSAIALDIMQSNTLLCLNQFGPRKSSLTPFFLKQLTYFLKSFLDAYIVGRIVSILKNDAQSCLCNMLKSDILATFWCIAFENPFNGD